ncbi:MAG: helix-turn-helix domain-containing protein [Halopseudomonas sp.]
MADYGQFCPVAKATELIGERWTLLILRELLLGSHRFNEFQRGLSRISPSLLTKRLKQLENAGIIVRKAQQGRKGYDYFLSAAGKELAPIIEHLAVWGMRWAQGQLSEDELDVEFLMWDLQRRLQTAALPGGETVICFIFNELAQYKSWWLIVRGDDVDLCTENPGKDVDLYISSSVASLVRVWQGELELGAALQQGLVNTQGNARLAKSMPDWLGICLYADIRPADQAMKKIAVDDWG